MIIEVGLTRKAAVVCIGTGIVIFLVALVGAISMYLSFSPIEGTGLTLVPGLLLFNAYMVLSLCNLIGGLIIYFSSENNKRSLSRGTKAIFFFAAIAQALPIIYINLR
jgi:hypothetical protein